jgi:MoaA/NifB/PqqE/SkfB family radical SAM enzyme
MDPSPVFTSRIFDFFRAARHGAAGARRPWRMIEAAIFQRRQAARRARHAKAGLVVPPILIASITRKCNLDCVGCYAKALRPGAGEELGDEAFMDLFREAIDLGVGTFLLAGGEPLMRRALLEKASRLRGALLPVFTNGTLVDEAFIDLAARSSLVPVLSLEGGETETDARRGAGIHDGVKARMEAMRKRGILFGASITLSSRNADIVLGDDYLGALADEGISVLFLVEFVPVTPGTQDLVLTAAQKEALEAKGEFAGLPYPVVVLPGDEDDYGGCLAAGRGFLHLAPDGRLEACPFAPFSDSNAAERGLRSALGSPLMKAIREHHGELTETSGGCALWNKAGWVNGLSTCASRGTLIAGGASSARGASSAGEEPVSANAEAQPSLPREEPVTV